MDVAFDAAGVQIAVDTAIKAVRPRGTLVNIALWGDKRVSLDMMDMLFGERRYQAGEFKCVLVSNAWLLITFLVVTYIDGDFEEVIEAIHTGKIKPAGMITKVIGLHEVAEEGFRTLVNVSGPFNCPDKTLLTYRKGEG